MLRVAIGKQLPDFQIDICFKTKDNILVLFGPSGSGKTTILKCIAGLIKPDFGCVSLGQELFFSENPTINIPPQRRKIGVVFQDYALFPHFDTEQNILYGATKNNKSNRNYFDELLNLLEIRHIMKRYPSELSGGEKQRVALARALMIDPKLMLLDEPFAALDYGIRDKLHQKLLEVQRTLKIPMVLVTHDPGEARKLGEQIIMIQKGKVDSITQL